MWARVAPEKILALVFCPLIHKAQIRKAVFMGKPKDITGLKFGKLTAIKLDHIVQKKHGTCHYWLCECDCGNKIIVLKSCLIHGNTKSCGCYTKEPQFNINDIVGKKFGNLSVLKFSHRVPQKIKGYTYYYLCKCTCGDTCVVERFHLKYGHTQSCGCLQKSRTSEASKIHGLEKSRLYHIWQGIKRRCLNGNEHNYPKYGGRGIKIYKEWVNNPSNFINWALANGYTDNLTIDRIDVNGDYEPSNCRWVTQKEQSRNKRNTLKISYNGKNLPLAEWCEILNLKYSKIHQRIYKYKWSIERSFNTP